MAACWRRPVACLRNLLSDFFDYETPVMLRTKAKGVGIIYRVIQTATLAFFFMYSIVYLKGYQLISDSAVSVILTQIHGEPFERFRELVHDEKFLQYCHLEIESNNPDDTMSYFHGGRDILIPLDFALMTQKHTRCPEDPMVPNAKCDPNNNKCVKHKQLPMGNGKMTGRCVPAIITNDTVCEVHAWCPVISSLTPIVDVPQNSTHSDTKPGPQDNSDQLSTDIPDAPTGHEYNAENTTESEPPEEHPEGVEAILDVAKAAESDYYGVNATDHGGNGIDGINYQFIRMKLWTSIRNVTIVIKNPVEFLAFKESRSNYNTSGIPCWRDPYYDMINSHCPVFSVEDILEDVADKIDNVSAKDLMQAGGIVSCVINWECDFDNRDQEKSCSIEYIFTRVDQPRSGVGQRILFLSDHENHENPLTKRVAIKVSFIRFTFNVDVRAGKFDGIQLLFKLGAAFGLFSIATLLCEYVFLNTDWLVKRTVVEMKYLEPTDKTDNRRTRSLVVVQSRNDDQENDEASH